MIQIVVHVDASDPSPVVLLNHVPQLWKEYALETVADNVWSVMRREIGVCPCLIIRPQEDIFIPGVNSLITVRKTLGVFIPLSVGSPDCELKLSFR